MPLVPLSTMGAVLNAKLQAEQRLVALYTVLALGGMALQLAPLVIVVGCGHSLPAATGAVVAVAAGMLVALLALTRSAQDLAPPTPFDRLKSLRLSRFGKWTTVGSTIGPLMVVPDRSLIAQTRAHNGSDVRHSVPSCREDHASVRRAQPDTTRFAVLLCTHDGATYLDEQLRSLCAQTRRPDWIVVHDWGSTDGTREMLQKWQQAASGPTQWQLLFHDHAPGPCQSFLQGVAQCLDSDAPFDYLFFCDQDDVWHPEKLQAFAQALAGRQGVDLIYSDVALIDAAGALVAPTYLQAGGAFGRPMDMEHRSCLFVSTVSGMSMAVSRRFLRNTRSLWERPGWHMHDWAISICVYLSRAQVVFIPRALVNYRQHGANLVGGTGPGSGRTGVGQRRQASGIWSALVRARRYVLSVHRQYQSCVNAPKLPAWRQIPAMERPPMVALAVLRGRSLPLPKRLKVALGYLVLWPWR